LAVYFGSGSIKNIHHAACGLTADIAGIMVASGAAYWFFE